MALVIQAFMAEVTFEPDFERCLGWSATQRVMAENMLWAGRDSEGTYRVRNERCLLGRVLAVLMRAEKEGVAAEARSREIDNTPYIR